ncbi:MAG: tyrosine-type recombinase/integrase, partial [Psychromonas sp.]
IYPIRLRFHQSRNKATWFFVQSVDGKVIWKKISYWPTLNFDDIRSNLSAYQTKFNLNPSGVIHNSFSTINLLADWYLKRSKTDSSLSALRKTTIKWAITCHIKPLMGDLKIADIDREALENTFFWPLQKKLKNSTVRSVWNVLKQLFTQAMFLKLIEAHELVALKFTHFIKGKITPEPTRLRSSQLSEVYQHAKVTSVPTQVLVILMLAHGTRIGETRQLKWCYFCFETKELNIPGCITKNGDELTIPLTDHMINLLTQYRHYQQKKRYQGIYLFPNIGKRNSISACTANAMIQEVSLGNWTSRSLRKIFRSTLLELGVDSEVAEMMINHRRGTLSDTYIHTTVPKLKRQALEKYHAWLQEQVSKILCISLS